MAIPLDNQTDIYRKTAIPEPSPEHILQAGLGCELQATGLISAETNSDFGGTIDKALLEDYALPRALLGLATRRGGPIPVEAASGDYDLHGDSPVSKRSARPTPPWTITPRPDGRTDIRVQADTMERAQELARHAKRSIGAEAAKPIEVTATAVRKFVPQIQFPLRFGGPVQFRAVAKSCFNAFALCKGPTTVLTAPFDPIREYILYGVDNMDGLASGAADPHENFSCFDLRTDIVCPLPAEVPSGVLDHRLVIRGSPETGVVYATLELFGHLPFSVLLTSEWTGDDFCWALIADSRPDGTGHRTTQLLTGTRPSVPRDTILAHALDQAALVDRCRTLFGHLQHAAEGRSISAIPEDALKAVFGTPDGKPVTQEQLNRLAHEVAERYVFQQMRIDREIPLDPPEIG